MLKNRIYQDKNGDKFELVQIRSKSVLLKPIGKHSYVEYTSFSEALDPTMVSGHIEFLTFTFDKEFSPVPDEETKAKIAWKEDELMFAYFVAKFGKTALENLTGLGIRSIVRNIKRSATSFNMQVAVFRNLMFIAGYQLSNSSALQRKIVIKNNNLTSTKVRDIVAKLAKNFKR